VKSDTDLSNETYSLFLY